jgi:uncharacterized membrane protein YgdD (TMEM256/DUF423 family)
MERICIGLAALFGATAVAMAAVAAHVPVDAASLAVLRSGVQMQGWHALALLFTGLWAARGGWPAKLAGAAFALGIVMFSGSLYALALRGTDAVLAPAGGILLIAGWLLLAISALRRPR